MDHPAKAIRALSCERSTPFKTAELRPSAEVAAHRVTDEAGGGCSARRTHVHMDCGFEMSTTEDRHPVQTFPPDGPDEALSEGIARGAGLVYGGKHSVDG